MSDMKEVLDRLSRLRGVSGALLVSLDDGLIVAEASMDGVDGQAVAALTASLRARLGAAMKAARLDQPSFVHLAAERGALMAVPAGNDLLVVAVADANVNVGLARVELLQAAEQVVG